MTTETVEQPTGFGTNELCITLGITYRQLDYWMTCGYIEGGNPGSGRRRTLSDEEVRVLRYMVVLIRQGVAVDIAAKGARHLARGLNFSFGAWCLTPPSDASVDRALAKPKEGVA